MQTPLVIDDHHHPLVDDNDIVYYNFVALKSISKGDEILWDYECSEYELLDNGFVCTCGSSYCRGRIKGFKHHADLISKAYGHEYIAPYLLKEKIPNNMRQE